MSTYWFYKHNENATIKKKVLITSNILISVVPRLTTSHSTLHIFLENKRESEFILICTFIPTIFAFLNCNPI